MNTKKALLLIAALALVCAVSVAGSFAFLKNESNAVKNTFVADGGGKIIDDDPETPETEGTFEIVEKKVEKNPDGTYKTTSENTTSGNTYDIVPGLSLPKAAVIDITGKTTVPAYLYVEVVDSLTAETYEYTVDTNNWTPLMSGSNQVTGAHGGKVWVYSNTKDAKATILKASDAEEYKDIKGINILKDNKVVVKDVSESTIATVTDDSLTFYGYLSQASAGASETVPASALLSFNSCFAIK